MGAEVGTEVWITVAVTIILGLGAALWKGFGRQVEKSEEKMAKDIERVDRSTKDEIARVDKRIDDHRGDQIKLHERTAVNESELKRLNEEIGGHDSGIRGWLHELSNAVSPRFIRRQQRRRERDERGGS